MVQRSVPRVLIVDDQPRAAEMLARLLGSDAEVVIALSGQQAQAALVERADRFDLVLCDILMPGMSGIELFERVRALAPHVAATFVFMTGGISAELESRIRGTGAPCLEKPLHITELQKLLASVLLEESGHLGPQGPGDAHKRGK